MDTLKAEKRDMSTKAKKLRREGYIPGNIVGREITGSIPVKMERQETERLLKTKRKGSQILLDVEGQVMDVLIKDLNYNSMKEQYEEIDFQALVSSEKVHSVAEIVIRNHEKVQHGVVRILLEEIAYKALPSALVETVEIDLDGMKPGDSIKVSDLPIADNSDVDLITSRDSVVVTVSESHASVTDEAEETEEEEK
ncbi:MAG: 50S ribosomal protein L25 [Clostridiales bacterium]|nr:50S ribosomal protein L25 [Clostridiales bacterium]